MNILNYLNAFEVMRTKTVEFKKDSTIYKEDEKCDSIGIIESGTVEIATYLENGVKIVFNTLESGEMFGSNLVFSSQPIYKGNVVATSNCKICFIHKDDLKVIFAENEDFLVRFLNIQSDFTKNLNYRIKLLSMSSAKDRVMFAVESAKNNIIHLTTVNDFADNLGLTREATSRTLAKLVDEGLITYDNRTIKKKKRVK